jgi:hypothetical protein
LACGPRTGTRVGGGLGRRRVGLGRVRPGHERGEGDDRWGPPVVGCGAGGGGVGLAAAIWAGWAALKRWAAAVASWAKRGKRKRAATGLLECWAEMGKGKGQGLTNLKKASNTRIQT